MFIYNEKKKIFRIDVSSVSQKELNTIIAEIRAQTELSAVDREFAMEFYPHFDFTLM